MSSSGVGQGLERGVRMAGDFILKGLAMKQDNERFQQNMDYRLEWDRGTKGLGPSYEEEEQDAAMAATRPAIPSSTPITTPGPLGIPQTRFSVGKPVQPMPAAVPNAPGGAMGLLLPSMRPPSLRMPPRRRRRY